MVERLVEAALRGRVLVADRSRCSSWRSGVVSFRNLPIDAVPDITNVQVQILTRTAPLGPVEVERYVTFPIEAAMSGLPDVEEIRSVSRFGLSAVTVVFKDDVNVYFARQLVSERLPAARESNPAGLRHPRSWVPSPPASARSTSSSCAGPYSPMELKEILDWQIAYRLRSVPGVTEVSGEGGFTKQYQVVVDPAKLVVLPALDRPGVPRARGEQRDRRRRLHREGRRGVPGPRRGAGRGRGRHRLRSSSPRRPRACRSRSASSGRSASARRRASAPPRTTARARP